MKDYSISYCSSQKPMAVRLSFFQRLKRRVSLKKIAEGLFIVVGFGGWIYLLTLVH